MGIIAGHLLGQIGARFQVKEIDLAVFIGDFGVEQLAVLVNLEGNTGQPGAAHPVVFDDTQGRLGLVGDGEHIVLHPELGHPLLQKEGADLAVGIAGGLIHPLQSPEGEHQNQSQQQVEGQIPIESSH